MGETPIPEYRVRISAALYEALAAYAKTNHYPSVRSVLEAGARDLLLPRTLGITPIPGNFISTYAPLPPGQTIAEIREELLNGE